MKYVNGDLYTGEVKNDKPDGKGFFKSAGGDIQEGTFTDGKSKDEEKSDQNL